jgi:predicted HD phosphohydrolase
MVPLDREEFGRPFSQARHTLDSARRDAEEGDYDWAAFNLLHRLGGGRVEPRGLVR